MNRLVVGTTNSGKLIEVELGLARLSGWQLVPLPPATPPIEETGATFVENAAQKASHFSRHVRELTLGDDSGLCVSALEGRPGLQSARYAPTVEMRMSKLLGEMRDIPDGRRDAKFFCALALARAGKVIWTVEREVFGRIAREASGAHGFGYDPVFFLPELGKTMAELSTEDKNRLSARGKALAALRQFLTSL